MQYFIQPQDKQPSLIPVFLKVLIWLGEEQQNQKLLKGEH